MAYKWEKESLKKFGDEVTLSLMEEQKEYEEEHKDNDCKYCGAKNEGSIIESDEGIPLLIHYGLRINGCCDYCGRHE